MPRRRFCCCPRQLGAQCYWQVQSGDWSNPSNWSGGVPTSNDPAELRFGTVSITLPGEVCDTLVLSNGNVQMSSGGLTGFLYVGWAGPGTFSQSGGTTTSGELDLGLNEGQGVYNLSGSGLLSVDGEYVGYNSSCTGIFTQSGGTNIVTGEGLCLSCAFFSSGTYNLNGGMLVLSSLDERCWDGSFQLRRWDAPGKRHAHHHPAHDVDRQRRQRNGRYRR